MKILTLDDLHVMPRTTGKFVDLKVGRHVVASMEVEPTQPPTDEDCLAWKQWYLEYRNRATQAEEQRVHLWLENRTVNRSK